jgi:hypothetical protein
MLIFNLYLVLLFLLLQGLVGCWRIDQVSVLLKCIHRNIQALGLSAAWREAWRQLVASVQAQMVAIYGHPLLVQEHF